MQELIAQHASYSGLYLYTIFNIKHSQLWQRKLVCVHQLKRSKFPSSTFSLKMPGPVELATVGVSIAVFNQVSRIAIFPLVSVTTSFVAEEDTLSLDAQESESLELGSTKESEKNKLKPQINSDETTYKSVRKHIPSASTALVIGCILGLIQTVFLIFGAKPILNFMGVSSDSPMLNPAQQYLTLRSLGAPAVLLSLAVQGVFRGIKDINFLPHYDQCLW